MRTQDADRFSECLHWAEDQLHWGTDPRALDEAAQALARLEPGHVVLVEQLAQRAAVLRAARRELVRRSTLRPPVRPEQPARLSAGRA